MIEFLTSQFGFSLVLMVVLISVIMTCVAYAILLERKVSAWIQDRIGPNRAGPFALFQPMADGVKMFLKEDIIPANVDKPLFIIAPAIAFITAMIGYAVIPWGGTITFANGQSVLVQVASVDIGLLYIVAIGSMGVYGIVLGGWSSNNKYSFYGGVRAAAQMLSYEIPMGLAILVVVLTAGHLRLEAIVAGQMDTTWNVLLHPLAFLVLLVCVFAETNRLPFDLAEAEQELIGGYQTEYSSMKMALFFLGEYAHMITGSAFMVVLFFGGWELFPFSGQLGWAWVDWFNGAETIPAAMARFAVMLAKIGFFIFVFMWVRWTVPRFRFDQLMRIAWRGMVPIGLALVVWAVVLLYLGRPVSVWAPVGEVAIVLGALAVIGLAQTQATGRQAHMPAIAVTESADPQANPKRIALRGGK